MYSLLRKFVRKMFSEKSKKGKGGTKKFGSGHYPEILNLKNWAGYVRIKKSKSNVNCP